MMKKQKMIYGQTATTVLLIAVLPLFSQCSKKDMDSGGQKDQRTAAVAIQPPPDVDIHRAALLGDLKAIQQHIKAGTDLNAKEPAGGSSPLITATVFGKIVDIYIDSQAGISKANSLASFISVPQGYQSTIFVSVNPELHRPRLGLSVHHRNRGSRNGFRK